MSEYYILWIRTKRYVRLWFLDAIAQTIAPLTDTNARLNYIGIFVVLFLIFPQLGPAEQSTWLTETHNGLRIFTYSIPIFFLFNLIFATFRIRKIEKNLGEWFGPRFIYHDPQRLITVLVDESNNTDPLVFSIKDAEDDSLVSYVVKTDRTDNRAKVELAWPGGQRMIGFDTSSNTVKLSARLPSSRKMSLLTHVEPHSTVTTVRVFMTGWEVGKGDGKG